MALKQGMSMRLLFSQLQNIRHDVDIPLLLMGYLNPVMQYGIDNFCLDCAKTGIDGVILPDMPLEVFEEEYQSVFERHNLYNIFLITPQTSPARIRQIDDASRGFIYMVSSSSTTGIRGGFSPEQTAYFGRIRDLRLRHPRLIGFGIADQAGFAEACQYAEGAIIGSAFVEMLGNCPDPEDGIREFFRKIRD
jgi:tryptophan synthase alpha chain